MGLFPPVLPPWSSVAVGALAVETVDGVPAEPPTFESAIPNLRSGDTIPLGRGRTLRVVGIRDDDADQPPVLVVEDEDGRISR
jgi:hypothetical protein